MVILSIVLIFMGVLFTGFGYFIYAKGKYDLINNFEKEKRSGKLDDGYAKRVGLIELIGGGVSVLAGIIAIIINSTIFTTVALVVCVLGIIVVLMVNRKKSLIKS